MTLDLFDPPAPTLPDETLHRRRVHLSAELARAPELPARRVRLRPIAAAVAVAALAVALAAVLSGRLGHDRMTLVSQALAAIGNRPTIHVLFDYGRAAVIVDLRTGKTTSVDSRAEIWADPKLGTAFVRTVGGRVTEEQTYGRQGARANGDVAWLRAFVNGYRTQLRDGSYHTVGRGTVAGQPVEWVAGKPITTTDGHTQVEEIAISRSTYKPVDVRWRVDGVLRAGGNARVLVAETLPRNPVLFSSRTTIGGGSTAFPRSGHGIGTTIAAARAAMSPDPVVPPIRLAGMRRSWIGEPAFLLMPANSYRDQVAGVTFYYGSLFDRVPAYTDPFVAVTEVSDPSTAHKLWGPGLFRRGAAVLDAAGAWHTATLKTHGVYVLVEASSRAKAIAAARALARAG